MDMSDRKAVVGDIGATHVRFAITDIDELSIDHYAVFRTDSFSSIKQALVAYLRSVPTHPGQIGIAVSGLVEQGAGSKNNPGWSFGEEDILAIEGVDSLLLLNGTAALANVLPFLGPHDIAQLGGKDPDRNAPKVVIGAGNSLGIGALVPMADGWKVMAGQGGHMAFLAANQKELDILDRLMAGQEYVSAEMVLSATGLAFVHALELERAGRPASGLTADAVIDAAGSGDDPVAAAILADFAIRLGRFAGDIALLFEAGGGLYLAGGIPPRILDVLGKGGFRDAFENKGRWSTYLAELPVFVIKAQDAGLRGVAVALSSRHTG